jgi:hypothetical protein
METEIVFCERCGVSIPEQDVAQARQASGGRDLCRTCVGPAGSAGAAQSSVLGASAEGDLKLYFCENCRVSIAVSDVLTGTAKAEGPGYLCAVCSRSTPAERVARRTAVEREMAAVVGAPAGGGRPTSDPIYFCDACNSSIPATLVATGRALVAAGRTYCERCRPRMEAERSRPAAGVGIAPVVAAAFLAAAATAGVALYVQKESAATKAEDRDAALEAALGEIRRDVRTARGASETAKDVAERSDRYLRDMEGKIGAARADAQAARTAAEKAAAQPSGAERVARLERQVADLGEAVKLLREDMATLAAERRAPAPAPVPAPVAADPPAMDGAGVSTVAEPAPAPGGGDGVATPSPQVQRCIGLLGDKDAAVRFSAAIELGKLGDRSAAAALARGLRSDDDPFVRRACARSIGELKAYEVFLDLVEGMLDGEEYVAVQCSRVIKEMTGQDFGFKQNQAKGDRKKVADRAKKWWEENRDKLAGAAPAGGNPPPKGE